MALSFALGALWAAGCAPPAPPTPADQDDSLTRTVTRALPLRIGRPTPLAVDAGSKPDATLPCGKVSYEGCCDGETVWYCKDKKLYFHRCGSNPKCGWDPVFGIYDCGTTGKAEPSGTIAKSCSVTLGEAGVPATDGPPRDSRIGDKGPGCGGVPTQGCCDGQTLWYCKGGAARWVNCGLNPACGWNLGSSSYTCGTTGKADPAGSSPLACSSVVRDASLPGTDRGPRPDRGTPDARGLGCGAVTKQGCCDGNTLWWCSAGMLHNKVCGSSKCGWNPAVNWYACVGSSAADPSGKYPQSCKKITKDSSVPPSDIFVPDRPVPDLYLPDIYVHDQATPDKSPDTTPVPDRQVPDTMVPDAPSPDQGMVDGDDDDGCSCTVGRSPAETTVTPTLPMLAGLLTLCWVRRSVRTRRRTGAPPNRSTPPARWSSEDR